jgi:hypothetical protein
MASLLSDLIRDAVQAAGPRYTPGIDETAPNLRIDELADAIDTISHSQEAQIALEEFEKDVLDAWQNTSVELKRLFRRRLNPSDLAIAAARLRHAHPGQASPLLRAARRRARRVERVVRSHSNVLYNLPDPGASEDRTQLQARRESLRKLSDPIFALSEYLRSRVCDLRQTNLLLITGAWGTGKTHFLCDVCMRAEDRGTPAVMFLAQTLPERANPLDVMAARAGFPTGDAFLRGLNRLGEQAGRRTLLVVDGLNEGDRDAWRSFLPTLSEAISRLPNLALVISCRTPFEEHILTAAVAGRFVELTHRGFTDIEFDAQRSFFLYYGIPTPHIPLLTEEFSRPLFLKILCSSIAQLPTAAKRKRIFQFASGQKAMTKLLEDFVIEIGHGIEKEFGLEKGLCWKLLKGNGDSAAAIGFAPKMAEANLDYVTWEDARKLVKSVVRSSSKFDEQAFIRRLINSGILIEETAFTDRPIHVIRLPYQRFSDHLICRHLLARHLNTASRTTIRRSFYSNRPLGRLFADRTSWGALKSPNLVSALMLEFPQRVKRRLPPEEQELVYVLPVRMRTANLVIPFIDGLVWREKDSFGPQTDRMIDLALYRFGTDIQQRMLEVCVALSSRPGHVYSSGRLWLKLSGMTLADRDLMWSEFLRSRPTYSVVYRLLIWVEATASDQDLSEDAAMAISLLLALFLTSTVRTLRDRATRALVTLGDRRPAVVFSLVIKSWSFNDPYVRERVLAAAYGVAMRTYARDRVSFLKDCEELADFLRCVLSPSTSGENVEHILMRDYAEGILELVGHLSDDGRVAPPETRRQPASHFPPTNRISQSVVGRAKRAIRMDFGNYTLGRLLPSRGNYDYNHAGYKRLLKQVSWRIIDLGFDADRFNDVDAEISNSNSRFGRADSGEKVDRYGKKYSWIAFYEAAGWRLLRGEDLYRYDVRLSDVDIDPSFPDPPLTAPVPTDRIDFSAQRTIADWMGAGPTPNYKGLLQRDCIDGHSGPWSLLHGFVQQRSETGEREVFTFLRCLLVDEQNLRKVRRQFLSTPYPGNNAIPDLPENYYLFAGEIGWSAKFGLCNEDGARVRAAVTSTVFDRVVPVATRGRAEPETNDRRLLELFDRLHEAGAGELGESEPPTEAFQRVLKRIKAPKPTRYRHIAGAVVEIPAWRFAWESYHSTQNNGGNPEYPSPAIVDFLGLEKRGGEADLFDLLGKRATICRNSPEANPYDRSHLLYIRSDLLRAYLGHMNKRLIWLNWGERGMHHSVSERLHHDSEMRRVWDTHAHIHKRLYAWTPSPAPSVREVKRTSRPLPVK